jgi:hypothetical protein
MPWPLSQDYNEAIQNPAQCFADAELRQGEVETNALGLPAPRSGNFADVYAVVSGQRKWAVKCFTRQIPGLQERYQQISLHLEKQKPSFMVDFVFQEQGIRVRDDWYPILKMQWVEGLLLNQFVRENLDRPQVLDLLSQLWVRLSMRLREAEISHCDLQHGNVLLVPGKKAGSLHVRLVDYDGMCVPSLTLLKSIEVGHPAFQHPQRQSEGIYSLEVDRFSHLVIYTALRALMVGGKALWDGYDDGDNLLFRPADYQAPGRSPLFKVILTSSSGQVRKLGQVLTQALAAPLERAPLLGQLVSSASVMEAPSRPATPAPARTPDPQPALVPVAVHAENVFASELSPRPAAKAPPQRSIPVLPIVGAFLLGIFVCIGVAWLLWGGGSREERIASDTLPPPPVVLPARPTQPVRLPPVSPPSIPQNRDAILIIVANEPIPEVIVDNVKTTPAWSADGKKAELPLKAGVRRVVVKKEGFTSDVQTVNLLEGERSVLTARLERANPTGAQDFFQQDSSGQLGQGEVTGDKMPSPVSPSPAPMQAGPRPVPPPPALEAALTAVKQELKEDYAQPKIPADLPSKLFRLGQKASPDPARQFVLLREARDKAAARSDEDLALQAVDEMAKSFVIDSLEDKTAALEVTAKVDRNARKSAALAETLLDVVKDATEVERFDLARRLMALAYPAASRASDKALQTKVSSRGKEVQVQRQAYEKVQDAVKQLAAKPDDPALNLTVGRYYYFRKKQDKGLQQLARGSDPLLAELASQELKPPTTEKLQAELGDKWRKFGDKARGLEKTQARHRAYHWYLQAAPGLHGTELARVQAAMNALAKEVPGIRQSWEQFDIGQGEVHQGVLFMKPGTSIATKREYSGDLLITLKVIAEQHSLALHAYGNASIEFQETGVSRQLRVLWPPRFNYSTGFSARTAPLVPMIPQVVEWRISSTSLSVTVNGRRATSMPVNAGLDLSQKGPIRISAPRGYLKVYSVTITPLF